ncbi:MAG: hypothetical protein ACRELE_03005 [Gemmatimonadales bacterium]
MREWIATHTVGWPIFVTSIVLLTVLVARAFAAHRPRYITPMFLAVWLGGVIAFYTDSGIDHFRRYALHLWSAQVLTLVVVVAVPLALVLCVLVLWKQYAPSDRWRSGAVIAAVVGVVAITLTSTLSGWMLHLLHAWIRIDRRRG